MANVEPRKGSPDTKLDRAEFERRYLAQFDDPAFDAARAEINKVAAIAWDGYSNSRKSPRTRKAGAGFKDPIYDLSVDWLAARDEIEAAQLRHEVADRPARVLLINGSSRNEHTCPGEVSKSYRLATIAGDLMTAAGIEVDLLDLSRITAEYGRNIHPCKACFSTSAALCHWPCSCYPNHSLGQTQDWMNEIYPLWVAADGIMIVTPVNWYQASSPLKLMIDRLVCADGGNPDPTSTHGKKVAEAKALELDDWPYPRHLEGRLFSLIVHGDSQGAEGLRRMLADWLTSMHLTSAGPMAEVDRYIGYYKPYATSHQELDADKAVQEEVRNAARTLIEAIDAKRSGMLVAAGEKLAEPRAK
jgi:multimeric flavodoxin WrbA